MRSTPSRTGPGRIAPFVARVLAVAAAAALWEAGSDAGVISAFILPAPHDVARSFLQLVEEDSIFLALVRTSLETLGAFLSGAALGLMIGWTLHRYTRVGRAFTDWVGAFASSPLVLLYPVFLVVIGRNEGTIVVMGALVAAPSIALKTKEGLDGVRPVLTAVGRTLNLSPWRMFRLVQLPAALPTIFTGLRLGLIFALINTVGVEFLLGFDGLGLLISDLGDRFDLSAMYAAILFVLAISAAFLYVTQRAEEWLLSSR
jgi:ABC-type nitrate/sulfonate/bicarbonate transport system permease component